MDVTTLTSERLLDSLKRTMKSKGYTYKTTKKCAQVNTCLKKDNIEIDLYYHKKGNYGCMKTLLIGLYIHVDGKKIESDSYAIDYDANIGFENEEQQILLFNKIISVMKKY